MELKAITNNYNDNTIGANTHIQKMGNIPLYHASKTFRFFNTFPLKECAFVLKDVKSLKTLPYNSINIMCLSILEKYIKKHNSLSKVSLIEFVVDHDMVNVNKKGTNFI